MKKIFINLITAAISALCFLSCSQEPYDWNKGKDIVSVTNLNITYPQLNTIKFSFSCQQNVETKITDAILEYGTYENYDKTITLEDFNPNGENTVEINDLEFNSNYSFRVQIKIPGSDYITMFDQKHIIIPTLENFIASPVSLNLKANEVFSSITATSTLSQVINPDVIPILEAGFFYGTDIVSYETGTKIQGTIENNVLSADITGLKYYEFYYIGAYVKTKEGVKVTNVNKVQVIGMNFDADVEQIIPKSKGFGIKFSLTIYDPNATIEEITIVTSAYDGSISPEFEVYKGSTYQAEVKKIDSNTTQYIYDLTNETFTHTDMKNDQNYNLGIRLRVRKDGELIGKLIKEWNFKTL